MVASLRHGAMGVGPPLVEAGRWSAVVAAIIALGCLRVGMGRRGHSLRIQWGMVDCGVGAGVVVGVGEGKG